MRIYDPRVGRFLSVDPLTKSYPWYTPYQFAGNSPIHAIDLDGMEPSSPAKFDFRGFLQVPAIDNMRVESHPAYKPIIINPKQFISSTVGEIDIPSDQKLNNAIVKNNAEVLKFAIADPQKLVEGDKLEWLAVLPIGRIAKGAKLLKSIPMGFKSFGHFKQFSEAVQAGFAKVGYKKTKIFMQGSAVTGVKHETKELFDVGRKSDFDIAVVQDDLFKKAKE